MKKARKSWKSIAPLMLGVVSIVGSAWGADEVTVKFSGNERILMPPTSDQEKEWDKTGLLGGSRPQTSEPVTTFIPSGGVTILKNPNLRKWLSDRQNWMAPKTESDTGLSQEEKAFGVRDYSGKSVNNVNSGYSGFNLEPENTATTEKSQKKSSTKTAPWETSKNASQNSKTEESSKDQNEHGDKGYSTWTPQVTGSSPLIDFNKNGDQRMGLSPRTGSSSYSGQAFSTPDLGTLPSVTDPGSFLKMDKARQAELRRKEDFQNLLQARPASLNALGGINDPVNLWQESGRIESNPVTGSILDDVSGRNKSDIFGFSPFGAAPLRGGRPGLFDGLSAKSLGSGSLAPALIPAAAPEFRPNPGVLEMPLRRKF
jgi:hypothetical protein